MEVASHGGKTGVLIDKDYSDTAAATVTGLKIDLDKNYHQLEIVYLLYQNGMKRQLKK